MAETGELTFTKKERVSGKTRIENIFTSGNAFLTYPFRVVYRVYESSDSQNAPALLISIPKKRLKRAVQRNRMKRLTKEVYRLNKFALDASKLSEGNSVDIAVIYVADKLLPHAVIEKSLVRALREVSKRIDRA